MNKLKRFLLTHMYSVTWVYDGWKDQEFISEDDPQKDWNVTLMTKINQVSAMIFKDNRRQGANVIIIPSNMERLIQSLDEYYKPDYVRCQDYEYIGKLAGRYEVYVIPDLTEDTKVFVCNINDVKKSILSLKNYSRIGVVKINKSFGNNGTI